jgi:hypothetical protein
MSLLSPDQGKIRTIHRGLVGVVLVVLSGGALSPAAARTVLEVAPASQDVPRQAGSASFQVSNAGTGTMTWTAYVAQGSFWLSITSGTSGVNSGTIQVRFSENTDLSPRTGRVRVTATGAVGSPQDVMIVQAGRPATPVLAVTPANQNVAWQAGTTSFQVQNTGAGTMVWTAEVVEGDLWLGIRSGHSGTNSGTIQVEFNENNVASPRTGTVRVTATGAEGSPKDVTVSQAARPTTPILDVSPVNHSVSSPAGTAAFEVKNTGVDVMHWTATVIQGDSWLSITSGHSGTNSGTIEVHFNDNADAGSRTGTVRVTATGAAGSPKDVTVTQSGTSGPCCLGCGAAAPATFFILMVLSLIKKRKQLE